MNYVLHLASWYPSKVNAFDGDFVARHYQILRKRYTCILLHVQEDPALEKGWTFSWKIEVTENGEYIFYIPKKNGMLKHLFRAYAYWKSIRYLFGLLGKPQMVHAHVAVSAGFAAYVLKKRYGLPFIVTEHSSFFIEENRAKQSPVLAYLLKLVYQEARLVLPVSYFLQTKMQQAGITTRFLVIPNPVAPFFFEVKKQQGQRQYIRLLHVSSFDEASKNISGLLAAIQTLLQQRDDFLLTLIGNGNLDIVGQKIAELALPAGKVKLIGPLQHEAVARQMFEHDLFILFSNYENLPCVLLEAQAAGLPCVATQVGGIPEIIAGDAYGRLVPPGDQDRFQEEIGRVMDHLDQYDASWISERARGKYSEEIVETQFRLAYAEALGETETDLINNNE